MIGLKALIRSSGMTVSEVAEKAGISRVHLSRVLNGHSRLSPKLALSIGKIFGVSLQKMLEQQLQNELLEHAEPIKRKVMPLLEIRSIDIDSFANTKKVRDQLPAFLRILIKNSVRKLTKVDFHANEESERPGLDGVVINESEQHIYVPLGYSVWEIGTTSGKIKEKATLDFNKRSNVSEKDTLKDKIFIFVTPRAWIDKEKWIEECKRKKIWKDVRVYDRNDLEQWLEQTAVAQYWLAKLMNKSLKGTELLEASWENWINKTKPRLPIELFKPAYKQHHKQIEDFFLGERKSLMIGADSEGESLAFLYAFKKNTSDEKLEDILSRIIVLDDSVNIEDIRHQANQFIAVCAKRNRYLFAKLAFQKVIYLCPAGDSDAEVELEHLSQKDFYEILRMAQFKDICSLEDRSGRSLTALRRLLSEDPAISLPCWVEDEQIRKQYLPMLLSGGFETLNSNDMLILSKLTGGLPLRTLKEQIQDILLLDDSPIWLVRRKDYVNSVERGNEIVGIKSLFDSWNALRNRITEEHLDLYYDIALEVIQDVNPRLKLEIEDRLFCCDKQRKYSDQLREGILKNLVFLSSSDGNNLFRDRVGSCLRRSERLVQTILNDRETVLYHLRDASEIVCLAQAAPESFLAFLEKEYRRNGVDKGIFGNILKPIKAGAFFGCDRTGLLQALNYVSTQRDYWKRVLVLLFHLSDRKIDDNIYPIPKSLFLDVIFSVIFYRKDIDSEEIIDLIRRLYKTNSRKMRFLLKDVLRTRALDQVTISIEKEKIIKEIMVKFVDFGPTTPADEINACLGSFADIDDMTIKNCLINVGQWARVVSDQAKAEVLLEVKRYLKNNEQYARRKLSTDLTKTFKQVMKLLRTKSVVWKSAWMFSYSAAYLALKKRVNYIEDEKQLTILRIKALKEILDKEGVDGLFKLINISSECFLIGRTLFSLCGLKSTQLNHYVVQIIRSKTLDEKRVIECLAGVFAEVCTYFQDQVWSFTDPVLNVLGEREKLVLLKAIPVSAEVLQRLEVLNEDNVSSYWADAPIVTFFRTPDSLRDYVILKLSDSKRFAECINNYFFQQTSSQANFKLLTDLIKSQSQIQKVDTYALYELVKSVLTSGELDKEQLLQIELSYLALLEQIDFDNFVKNVPHLVEFLKEQPNYLLHVISSQDSLLRRLVIRVYKSREFLGGSEKEGTFLKNWIVSVRSMAKSSNINLDLVDIVLGEILAHTPKNSDGTWPSPNVCYIFDEISSIRMAVNCRLELHNMRGVFSRSVRGGDQERELARKYERWVQVCKSYFVKNEILGPLVQDYLEEAKREDAEAKLAKLR